MSIDERSRHRLFLRLEEVLGPEEATVLMEHLPPVGWADVATKHDLEAMRVATKQDLEVLRLGLTAQFRGELLAQTRTIMFTVVLANLGLVVGVGGIVAVAA